MQCPKCNVEMVPGIAIYGGKETNTLTLVQMNYSVTADEMRLIDCLKCPTCGHSDDMKEIEL